MPSPSQTALAALVSALTGQDDLPPEPRRNEVAETVLASSTEGATPIQSVLIVNDGSATVQARYLGGGFEILRKAEVVLGVTGRAGADLDSAFDKGLLAIQAALAADRTLGGAVIDAEIADAPELDTESGSEDPLRIATVLVSLLYLSSQPF